MNIQEAEQYFRTAGELAKTQPDRLSQKAFWEEESQTPEYKKAFFLLREEAMKKRVARGEITSMTKQEFADHMAEEHVDLTPVGVTPWGSEILEFRAKGIRSLIIPVRLEYYEPDRQEARGWLLRRTFETKEAIIGHYPHY